LAPGAAILVSQGGEILLKKAYGFADIGNRIPVTTVTKFRIGSITKQFIAAAILKLQEEGKIIVTDKLSKFIPDFPRGEEVTIHHLLTHTSGIPSFTSQEGFLRLAVIHATEEEMLDTIKSDQYDFNPGEKFSYNNSGYYLLGTIIGKITGKFYGDYLREVFFGPLGMKNTGVHASNLILDNEATGYAISNGIFEKALNWDMSRAGGAGSLYSTVEDLNLWNEAVFNGKVLNDSSLKAAFTVVTLNSGNKPDEMDYACGWVNSSVRGVRFISHGGGLHGFLSQLVRQPDEQLTVAVITNCTPAQDDLYPNIVADNIGKYLLWQKMGSQPSFFSDTSVSSVDLTEFEGRYDYGNAMVLIVTAEGNELYAQMTGQARFRIFPRGNDEFYWKVVDARIRFLRNEAGDITGAIHFQGGGEIKVRRLPPIMGIIIDSSRLEKYSGKYEYQPGVVITLTASEGKLLATVAGQNQLVFVPVSGTEFSCLEMNAFLKFIPLEGENFNLEVNLGGNIRTISKME
jgi:CubicO group peptidase (beta-lactamase class C family)